MNEPKNAGDAQLLTMQQAANTFGVTCEELFLFYTRSWEFRTGHMIFAPKSRFEWGKVVRVDPVFRVYCAQNVTCRSCEDLVARSWGLLGMLEFFCKQQRRFALHQRPNELIKQALRNLNRADKLVWRLKFQKLIPILLYRVPELYSVLKGSSKTMPTLGAQQWQGALEVVQSMTTRPGRPTIPLIDEVRTHMTRDYLWLTGRARAASSNATGLPIGAYVDFAKVIYAAGGIHGPSFKMLEPHYGTT